MYQYLYMTLIFREARSIHSYYLIFYYEIVYNFWKVDVLLKMQIQKMRAITIAIASEIKTWLINSYYRGGNFSQILEFNIIINISISHVHDVVDPFNFWYNSFRTISLTQYTSKFHKNFNLHTNYLIYKIS